MKHMLRKLIHGLGYDLYRYPEACERLIPHLGMLLPIHHIDTVIDVGANVGQFASEVRALSRDVRIHSIEPNPVIYKTLTAIAAGDNRWTTHECALGRSSGKVMLNVFASSDFSSCLPANEFGAQRFQDSLTIADTVEVELRTLDELVSFIPPAAIGSRLLLKLDTQGFDMEVLLGAASVLESVQVVVTEASLQPLYQGAALFPEALEFMKAKGFTLSGFFPVSRNDDLSIIESDCVFVRVAGH
jgi:FkbM family methyltransferase